jgi:hypothetical protein
MPPMPLIALHWSSLVGAQTGQFPVPLAPQFYDQLAPSVEPEKHAWLRLWVASEKVSHRAVANTTKQLRGARG